jgi:hypothetical protein
MSIEQFSDNPFEIHISFHLFIEHLEEVARQETGYPAERARALLKEIEPYPELRTGITEKSKIHNHLQVIEDLLADLFPPSLSNNEIKAVTVPFHSIVVNQTQRLKTILQAAGPDFDMSIRGFDSHQFYVMSCCLVLNEFYNTNLDFGKPMFYDIPTASGIMRHYRILYNADFLELVPTGKARQLTPEDINLLINNYDDLELWKRMFPQGSYILKGFAILNLFDATVENAVSALKGTLITGLNDLDVENDFESIFRSIYKIPDLNIGFTGFDEEENKFISIAPLRKIKSFMLNNSVEAVCTDILGPKSYKAIMGKSDFFAISNTKQFFLEHPDSELAHIFLMQGINSFILAPVVKDDALLGVMELVSTRAGELNSVNAHKLEVVMPFLVNTIDRQITATQNQIQAIIQNEYTSLHPSVQWKFKKEAKKSIERHNNHQDYDLKEIVFENVYPLYGQIDIKGSSETRNLSIQKDLDNQIETLMFLLKNLPHNKAAEMQEKMTEFKLFTGNTLLPVRADMEQYIQHYIEETVHAFLKKEASTIASPQNINKYFNELDRQLGRFYNYRRKYDTTVSTINKKMAALLDEGQVAAQQIFPHYYERFKSDGVEHNLYIGASIAPGQTFLLKHFHRLRLWQLQVLCQMEQEHHRFKSSLPYPLEVTTLILAYSTFLSIRFRMDEKRFDVDGTYNARFEIVKKRIDKAYVKNSQERITQSGKITIVYASPNEELEYRGYIELLQNKGILTGPIEMIEVEELQSITGLKALRVAIAHEAV